MRMSEEKRVDVFAAISAPILNLRLMVAHAKAERQMLTPLEVDLALFRLEQEIWKRTKEALNLPPVR